MAGDTIQAKVFAKYLERDTTQWNNGNGLATLMNTVRWGTPAAGVLVDGGATGTTGGVTPPYAALLAKGQGTQTGAPKAYLNFLVFDRDFHLLDGGFIGVTTAAREYGQDGLHEELSKQLIIKKAGYVYLYLSNDNAALGGNVVEVFFDDFTVQHIKSPVVQQDDYYAFGLTFNSYQRENAKKNKYLYNGGAERQDDLDLGIDLTLYRAYDPSMCRWWQIDPKVDNMERWTPYNYSFNNPIRYNDPKGDCPPGVDCENFVKGAWNSVKAAAQFAADTWNSKGENLVQAANNLEMVATVARVAPGAVVDKIAGDFKQSMANAIAETGSTQGVASQILGEVTGGVILGAVTDKGLSKLGTVAKVIDKVSDVVPDGPSSLYKELPSTNAATPNRQTNITKIEFESNLKDSGYKQTTSKDGKTNVFTKKGSTSKYSTRNSSTQGSPTADYSKTGKGSDLKIRLKKEE